MTIRLLQRAYFQHHIKKYMKNIYYSNWHLRAAKKWWPKAYFNAYCVQGAMEHLPEFSLPWRSGKHDRKGPISFPFTKPHNGTRRLSQRAEDETGIILEHLHVKATPPGSVVQLCDLGEYEGPPLHFWAGLLNR